jgi:hypothetical protein
VRKQQLDFLIVSPVLSTAVPARLTTDARGLCRATRRLPRPPRPPRPSRSTMFSRFPLAGPRLPTLLLARSVSVSACAGAPGVGSTRLRRVAGLPRVLVDEAGRARRPLPPLNVAGAVATPQEGGRARIPGSEAIWCAR